VSPRLGWPGGAAARIISMISRSDSIHRLLPWTLTRGPALPAGNLELDDLTGPDS